MTTFYSKFRIGDTADAFCNVHFVNQKEPLSKKKEPHFEKNET